MCMLFVYAPDHSMHLSWQFLLWMYITLSSILQQLRIHSPHCPRWDKYLNEFHATFLWNVEFVDVTIMEILDEWLFIQAILIHESVMTSCRITGTSENLQPAFNLIALHIAQSRISVVSILSWPYLSSIITWDRVCLEWRLGKLRPCSCRGQCITALGKVPVKPAAASPATRSGFVMLLHCSAVNVVATSG